MESLSKAFSVYSKQPFLFVWSTLMYLILFLAFFFASLGLVMGYIVLLPVFGETFELQSLPTLAILTVAALLFLFFIGGLNAGLARAYRTAFHRERTSLTGFFAFSLDKAPEMFGIFLIRELVWLLLAGPAIALYVYFLQDYSLTDVIIGAYVLFATFIIHMLFTPAMIFAGAIGTNLVSSLKHSVDFMRKRHIFFIGLFILFALVWLLNFVPFIQLFSIFVAYPVIYTAMIHLVESSMKITVEEE
jgi:hypothetical protein